MKFFLGRKSTSFRTQRIVAKDVDLRPSAPKVLIMLLFEGFLCPNKVLKLGLEDKLSYTRNRRRFESSSRVNNIAVPTRRRLICKRSAQHDRQSERAAKRIITFENICQNL